MALTFRFDADGMMQAIKERLIEVANQMIQEFHREATSSMSYKDEVEIEPAQLSNSSIFEGEAGDELIVAKCYFYGKAIVEGFGVGAQADTTYWDDYVGSDLWNPLRKGKTVVGRAAEPNPYKSIWSGEAYTTGSMAGVELPWISRAPNIQFQQAEAWLMRDGETKIERAVETALTKFFMEEASNFFIQEDR